MIVFEEADIQGSDPLSTPVGLIADSHGNASVLLKAIKALAENMASSLVHLGDFFDSVYNENLMEVMMLLQRYHVLAVKGNNDYQVEKMLDNSVPGNSDGQGDSCLAFLKKTPLLYKAGNATFSHSMPYGSIRSFYEPIDTGSTERAEEIFENTNGHVFFCGHSHRPVLFRYKSGKTTREEIVSGGRIAIKSGERYIFIVGSAENGECGIYEPTQSYYERITF